MPESTRSFRSITLVGTHLPRRCGIATFTNDLAEAMEEAAPETRFQAVAMDDRPEGYRYPSRVWFEIYRPRLGEYRRAGDFLNLSKVDLVCVQHEYGLFGGDDGAYIVEMLRRLRVPSVVTMHTVLKEPSPGQLEVTRKLSTVADRLVVLSERGADFLRDIYDVPDHKIAFIPHGIPDVPFIDPNYFKDQFGVEGRKVILTFGLLSPNKGIENMIEAMPRIVKQQPDAVYIVLGATHPGVKAEHGEAYRTSLQRRVEELGLHDNVIFHNRFVELTELVEFLGAADVYVTPYLNEAQIVSGTLAYALGAGKATVSTPYWYAQEMLDDGRGRLAPFGDHEALGDIVADLFKNEVERHAMRKNAYTFTRKMLWSRVAEQYLDLFAQVLDERRQEPKPIRHRAARLDAAEHADLPELNLEHIRHMTDDCGVIQYARAIVPDRAHGYSVDDNACALIVATTARDYAKDEATLSWLSNRYLSYLDHAFDRESGAFHTHMSYDRRWVDAEPSEESHGRCLWALGVAVARGQTRGRLSVAVDLFHRAMPKAESFEHPRAWAYALIGIHAYLRRFGGDSHARRLRETLAKRLYDAFEKNGSEDWPWCEDTVSYANARLPHAMLLSGQWMFDNKMVEKALHVLDWLWRIQVAPDGHFAPVGCHGWFVRGQSKANFDQQPVEALCMIDACLEAYHCTQERHWVDRAYRCFNWFMGDNDLRMPLCDYQNGGCCDGLHPQGVNENQGAQATLAYLLSLLALYEFAHESSISRKPEDPEAVPRAAGSGNSVSTSKAKL